MTIIAQLSKAFDLTHSEARLLIITAPERYKTHLIQKRHGRGVREIAQPTAAIKALQRWTIETYLDELPIHKAAQAYRKGKSINDHASNHAKHSYLLKLDFEDFFHSIKENDFRKHLLIYKPELADELEEIVRILFWKKPKSKGMLRLSIGAPSSPFISNTIMYLFDSYLQQYCDEHSISYTRYADDLALSTNDPKALDMAFEFVINLCKKLDYPKLKLNNKKTVFTSKKFSRKLTGLVLTNEGKTSLGRERKRMIRAMAHHYKFDKLDETETKKLKGLLAFAQSIEPSYVASISKLLGELKFKTLISF